MIKKIGTNLLIKLFILLIVLTISILPAPKKVKAVVVPVLDPALLAEQGIFNASIWSKEYLIDLVAYTAANVAIDTVSTQLQNMILDATNSFVKDLEGELLNLENDIGNKLGVEIDAVRGCFPDLNLRPVPNPAWNKPKFQASITCRLDDVIPGGNIKTFYNDYEQGGIDAFMRTAFYQNPYRTATAITSELEARKKAAIRNERDQLAWGRGLRGVRDELTGLIKTPAAVVQKQLDNAFSLQLDRMKNADELTEVLVAIVSSYVSNALSGTF